MQTSARAAIREGLIVLFMLLMLLGLLLGGCVSPQTQARLDTVKQRIEAVRKEIVNAAASQLAPLKDQLKKLKGEQKALEKRATQERLASVGTITGALKDPAGMIPVAGPIVSLVLGAIGQFLTARAAKAETPSNA